jgi:hypothetical protein
MRGLLIFLIGFSIAIQNTCPAGLAAKTGFASPVAHCCCARKAAEEPVQTEQNNNQFPLVKGPAFVFIAQREAPSCVFCVPLRDARACQDDFYRSITLNPPEEPPRIS